ncbi:uncharacterized protein LOC109595763 isoform X2 [Aethina tumida]|uniref:uncharacterized protein LOC109595763 isoform X2 n=1 Tax=Aethina tumida TaxID=116153 RepID=UPI00096AFB78|nr:uncharacterized protein LOC109595763 isoform X2 [Aethina tumida]
MLSRLVIVLTFLLSDVHNSKTGDGYLRDGNDVWLDVCMTTESLLSRCMSYGSRNVDRFLPLVQECIKRRSLKALDRTISRDYIRIADGVELVRKRLANATLNRSPKSKRNIGVSYQESSDVDTDWKSQVTKRIAHVLETHVLKINLKGADKLRSEDVEGRRRKDKDMSGLLMFSFIAMGMIMVPLGFQFLAVLGGKALLLAKMALLLASIQGLKKLATSNLNYGFYQTTYEQEHDHGHGHGHWHYDRHWPYEGNTQEPHQQVAYYQQQYPPNNNPKDYSNGYPNPRYD